MFVNAGLFKARSRGRRPASASASGGRSAHSQRWPAAVKRSMTCERSRPGTSTWSVSKVATANTLMPASLIGCRTASRMPRSSCGGELWGRDDSVVRRAVTPDPRGRLPPRDVGLSDLSGNSSVVFAAGWDRELMSAERSDSGNSLEVLRARSVRGREAVLARVARVRLAIICGVAAVTCALAVLIASASSARSTAKTAVGAGVPGSVRPLFGDGSGDGGSGDGVGGRARRLRRLSAPAAAMRPLEARDERGVGGQITLSGCS